MSKGSKPRPCNKKKFDEGFERLFGSTQPATPEEITYEENIYHNGNHCPACESFAASPIGKAFKRDYIRELLSNSEFLWQAIGQDAVNTPAWIPLGMLEGEELEAAAAERRNFWDAEADKIATMIFHKDDAALGKYIRHLAESYTKPEVDMWFVENWEALK